MTNEVSKKRLDRTFDPLSQYGSHAWCATVLGKSVSVRSDCPACVMDWVIVSSTDSGHLEVGDGGEEGIEEAGLV